MKRMLSLLNEWGILDESKASELAKTMGLSSKGFGMFGPKGSDRVTHKIIKGQLVALESATKQTKEFVEKHKKETGHKEELIKAAVEKAWNDENLEFKPFTKQDWQSYNGATNFADGKDPLMLSHETVFQGKKYVFDAIIDGEGIGIHAYYNEEGEDPDLFGNGFGKQFSRAMKSSDKAVQNAIEQVKKIFKEGISEDSLEREGFSRF